MPLYDLNECKAIEEASEFGNGGTGLADEPYQPTPEDEREADDYFTEAAFLGMLRERADREAVGLGMEGENRRAYVASYLPAYFKAKAEALVEGRQA